MTHCPSTGPDTPDGGVDPSPRGAPPRPVAKPDSKEFTEDSKAEPATRRTLRCRTVTGDALQPLNYIRNLPPYALEGRLAPADDDAAPTPCEALLAALGSCLSIAIRANAVARVIAIKSLALDVEADCDTSAVWGVVGADGPKPVGFEAVRVTVRVEADAPRDVLRALVTNAVLWSPVANTVHDPVHLDVVLG